MLLTDNFKMYYFYTSLPPQGHVTE